MLLSEFRTSYPAEDLEASPFKRKSDWSSPLAIIIGHNENAEIIDVKTSDSNLLDKLKAIISELTPEIHSDNGTKSEQEKQTQRKYEYLTKYGTQILAIFKQQQGCIYLSANVENITGKPAHSLLGQDFFSTLHIDSQEKLRTILAVNPSTSPTQQNINLKLQHSDAKYYWYQFTIHAEDSQYVCIIENIHQHIQTQNTLQKAKLEAELALRTRSEFLANMSHELRTPLNAVIGFSQIMERGIFGKIENEHYSSYIRHIQESGHDLLAKIEDLLEIANIDVGRVSLKREEIYVNDLVKHVLKTQKHHAEAAKVSLSYIPKGNILLYVDRLKLQHILGHLVSNAVKYNQSGGEVTIEINRDGKNGIRLSVHDDGVGIDEIKCNNIRQSLKNDSSWTSSGNNHIGIGLALTKEFVEMHGGNVEISSSAGIGTTISLTLPRECIRINLGNAGQASKQLENS